MTSRVLPGTGRGATAGGGGAGADDPKPSPPPASERGFTQSAEGREARRGKSAVVGSPVLLKLAPHGIAENSDSKIRR